MHYTLLLRNSPVLDFSVENRKVTSIDKIHNEELVPLGFINRIKYEQLEHWLDKRSISAHRENLDSLKKQLKMWTPRELSIKNYGLSLSDQYWVRPENEQVEWSELNYFQNDFSNDIGNYLIMKTKKSEISLNSPDLTTNGESKKTWRIKDGKRFLLKGNLNQAGQESLNEAIVSQMINLMKLPNVTCVDYSLTRIKNELFSVSECFLSEHIELVPASYVYYYELPEKDEDTYIHLLKMCEKLEIPGVKNFLSSMLTIDYIIDNTDRHLGNFGFLRDLNTMKFIGPAPLYDNGSSLWADELTLINAKTGVLEDNAKTFGKFHKDQVKYIKNDKCFDKFDIKMMRELFLNAADNAKFDHKRMEIICDKVNARYHKLEKELSKSLKKEIERE